MSPAFDRSAPPAAAEPRRFRFPGFDHHRPAPGIDLYLAPLPRTGLIHLELLTSAGAQFDPAGTAGLAALSAALVDEGTTTRSSIEIAAAAEQLGGYVDSGADWDCTAISTSLLSEHLDRGLELLLDLAQRASFPAAELERLRRRTLTELLNRRAQPATLAQHTLSTGLYGDTPYGGYLIGSEESVRSIRRDQVIALFRHHAQHGPLRLIAAGDFDPDRLAGRLESAFPGRPESGFPVPPTIRPVPRDSVEIQLVDRPGSAQTELRIGLGGLPRAHPDFTGAVLLNTILGGKFTSRINLNLRERHGYTYGAFSSFSRRLGPGPFVVRTAVANPVAAAAAGEILEELRRIRAESVSEEELDDARSYLLGVFPYTVQTVEDVASRLADLAVYSLPDDHYDTMASRLAVVSRDDLLRIARRYLDPRRCLIVAVGPVTELRSQFAQLAEPSVVESQAPEPV